MSETPEKTMDDRKTAHSKSEYKRLSALGVDVAPPDDRKDYPELGKPIARLLDWRAPKNFPVPHGGIAARTFAEFPEDMSVETRYWFEGGSLYTAEQVYAAIDADRAARGTPVKSLQVQSDALEGMSNGARGSGDPRPASPPDGEWNCPDCKGSGDSGRTSRNEANQREPCGRCMGRGTLDYDPREIHDNGRPVETLYTHPPAAGVPTETAEEGKARMPLDAVKRDEIYREVQRQVSQLEADDRYSFAGWFPIAVKLIEQAHGIRLDGGREG